MKKILQSILLFLVISSKLLAEGYRIPYTDYRRSTGGFWDEHDQWDPHGVPSHELHRAFLINTEANPLHLSQRGKQYTIHTLSVSGNAWNLSNGNLRFPHPSRGGLCVVKYDGTQTLIFGTSLTFDFSTDLMINHENGTVRLQGEVTGRGLLSKRGSGTLLIEAPFSCGLELAGGTTGIAPDSLSGKLSINISSKLFALNGDLTLPTRLILFSNLDIIDNPDDPTPYSITLKGGCSGEGTLDHHSHGDLIFEGTDYFEGTIKTYAGYGRVVLNGDTAADIKMYGSEIAGKGRTRGDLTARNSAIISPGDKNEVGTLTFKDVDLDPSTILNFKFGSEGYNDRIDVNGNLTLRGTLNIKALDRFGAGTYTLFTYRSWDKNLGNFKIGTVPEKYDREKFGFDFYVQTTFPGKINLLVPDPDPKPNPDPKPKPKPRVPKPRPPRDPFFTFNFWDGDRTIADGTILGGSGVWNNTNKTWSNVDGFSKKAWNGYRAVFGGDAGIVDVQENVSFRNNRVHR